MSEDLQQHEHSRREKLRRWREELGIEPYGRRVDGLVPLANARAMFDEAAHTKFQEASHAARSGSSAGATTDLAIEVVDVRARAVVAGRCIQHRAMGKLVFIVLRDHSGDLQVSVSKAEVDPGTFSIASKLDYGDIVVAEGPVGATQRGEICIWADRLEVHCKSLTPPPEKYHGLTDAELRYRQRYVDMFANPETIRTFQQRSQIVSRIRRFMESRGYLEVETPMMQPIAGGAAARPFVTHHNALDMSLFLRIAPELYLKRLLVGGLPRVYEINRNFRNEGVDKQHNPEFTALEAYEAFGDCWSMLELTESMLHDLARAVRGEECDVEDAASLTLPFGDIEIDWSRPFARISYGELFERTLGFPMDDDAKCRDRAREIGVEKADVLDHWLVVNELFERFCEEAVDPAKPTFVTDYPAAISPLTRPQEDRPHLAHRWELIIARMEMGTAYTELNDPDVQLAKFTEQLAGIDDEESSHRTFDQDFIDALKVGMPPAGGLGLGIDRIVMLMTNSTTIRDVILFPLLKPQE